MDSGRKLLYHFHPTYIPLSEFLPNCLFQPLPGMSESRVSLYTILRANQPCYFCSLFFVYQMGAKVWVL